MRNNELNVINNDDDDTLKGKHRNSVQLIKINNKEIRSLLNKQLDIEDLKKVLDEKKKYFKIKKKIHIKTYKKMKIIYYFLGFMGVIFSTISSFVTGIYSFQDLHPILIVSLICSLLTSIVNSISSFGNFLTKISQHKDAHDKYSNLIMDIENFRLRTFNESSSNNFINLLYEKELLILNYENLSCCFNLNEIS